MEGFEDDIGSQTKGKQGELIVLGKLLERGFKIYTPMVDIGTDCLIDVGEGNYKEIQVKYRENEPIFSARSFKPRPNFYFVCFLRSRNGDDFWIIPSALFKQLAKPTKTGNRESFQLRIGKEGFGLLQSSVGKPQQLGNPAQWCHERSPNRSRESLETCRRAALQTT